jgi:hypothetical protein
MNFNKITIHLEPSGTILLTPKRFYKISDHNVKYVIIYNLKLIHINPEIADIESEIPYYISNGVTNKLRANMLYPFMCYSNIDNATNCPYNFQKNNFYQAVLLKYNTFVNINFKQLEQGLLDVFLGIYPGFSEEHTYLKKKLSNQSGDHGLVSIVRRITNLVDFIICITNDVIGNFDYKKEYQNIDNGKFRPLSTIQNETNDYINMSVFGDEIDKDDPTGSFHNHFRLVILTILNKYYNLFVNNRIFDIETVVFEEPELITVNRFNTIINICDKDVSKHNIKKYAIISNQLSNFIFQKIDVAKTISEEDKQSLISIIKSTSEINIDEDTIYDELLESWRGVCVNSEADFINTKNVYMMDAQEICQELSRYSDFLNKFDSLYPPLLLERINSRINIYCNDKSVTHKDQLYQKWLLNVLRDNLLIIRSAIMYSNYTGVLKVKLLGTNTMIKVDINSSDTIDKLKFKIFSKLGIDPSKQQISVPNILAGSTILDNDRTIASYQIPNRGLILLNII